MAGPIASVCSYLPRLGKVDQPGNLEPLTVLERGDGPKRVGRDDISTVDVDRSHRPRVRLRLRLRRLLCPPGRES